MGDNAFSFSFRHIVNLSLEKMPLELWNRRGVSANVAGFASMLGLERACLQGSDFSRIFVLVKAEALQHIPHRQAFHLIDNTGVYANVLIHEIWDVIHTLGSPSVLPRQHGPRRQDGDAGSPPHSTRRSHANPRIPQVVHGQPESVASMVGCAYRAFQYSHAASVGDCIVILKIFIKRKLQKYDTFGIPSIEEVAHEDEDQSCLKPMRLRCVGRMPLYPLTLTSSTSPSPWHLATAEPLPELSLFALSALTTATSHVLTWLLASWGAKAAILSSSSFDLRLSPASSVLALSLCCHLWRASTRLNHRFPEACFPLLGLCFPYLVTMFIRCSPTRLHKLKFRPTGCSTPGPFALAHLPLRPRLSRASSAMGFSRLCPPQICAMVCLKKKRYAPWCL